VPGTQSLEDHRPVLRFDSREEVFPSAARGGPPRIYGHVVRQGGRTWLQYWIFYASNTQDRGIVRTGRHEGDWEFVQVRIGARGRPDRVTFAQHAWAEGCDWSAVRRRGAAPVAFVANGSHASYSAPGKHDRFFPDPNDEADGRGRTLRPQVERIADNRPAWVAWPGRWGGSRAGIWPGEESSPRGPRFQDERWTRPGSFHASAVECGSGPPWRSWQTVVVAGGVAGLALLGLILARRRRDLQSPR
jgi:MYXO-CTERM domain-containing protein